MGGEAASSSGKKVLYSVVSYCPSCKVLCSIHCPSFYYSPIFFISKRLLLQFSYNSVSTIFQFYHSNSGVYHLHLVFSQWLFWKSCHLWYVWDIEQLWCILTGGQQFASCSFVSFFGELCVCLWVYMFYAFKDTLLFPYSTSSSFYSPIKQKNMIYGSLQVDYLLS